jgi:hypothetical protein
MARNPRHGIASEATQYALIVVELVSGFLALLLLLGLIPGDGVDFNVLGSLVLFVPCALIYFGASRYRKRLAA